MHTVPSIQNKRMIHADLVSTEDRDLAFHMLLEIRGKAQRVERPAQTRLQNSVTTLWRYKNWCIIIIKICQRAKVGLIRCGSFDNMQVLILCALSLKCIFTSPQSFLGYFIPNMWISINATPKRHCVILPNLVVFGAHCVKVVDKAITMDNLRLLYLVVNVCRETAWRPRYKFLADS